MKKVEDYVVSIPDFPEPGIIFRDVTSVLQNAEGLKLAIDGIQEKLDGLDFDVIAGTESRGFIFGMPVAYNLGKTLPEDVFSHIPQGHFLMLFPVL